MSFLNKIKPSIPFKEFRQTYARILGFVTGSWKLLFTAFLLNIIFSIFETMSVALIQPIIQIIFNKKTSAVSAAASNNSLEAIKNSFYETIHNFVTIPNSMNDTLIRLSILVVIIFACKNFFKYLANVAGTKVTEGIIKNMRDTIFKKLTSLSVDFFSKSRQGHLISVITNDVTVVNGNTISSITTILKEGTQIVIFLMLLLAISPMLTLMAFSTSIISILIIRFAIKYLKKYASRMQNAMSDYTSSLQETLFGIRIIKAYNAENSTNDKFMSQTASYVRSAIKHRRVIALIPAFNELFAISALCFVLYYGGSQVLSGEMKGEDLLTFLFMLFSIMSPISSFMNQFTMFQTGLVSADRVFKVLDAQPAVIDGTKSNNGLNKSLEISNISFAYEEDKNVLRNCSMKVEKGKKVALVGSSGSGKSTMLDLIIRFYDPNSGEIALDGVNIRDLDVKQFRSLFGIVSQETLLFNDTIANNIKYGYEATDEEVIEAAKTANAYNFIKNMPDGIHTKIGDRGVLISGGERQRIAIARALIRKPQILVFDEATSALDAESEKVVQSAINTSLENRTAIIVAHRLSTIKDCDTIYVFDQGKIIESGNHQELISKNGVYKKLCDIQFNVNNDGE